MTPALIVMLWIASKEPWLGFFSTRQRCLRRFTTCLMTALCVQGSLDGTIWNLFISVDYSYTKYAQTQPKWSHEHQTRSMWALTYNHFLFCEGLIIPILMFRSLLLSPYLDPTPTCHLLLQCNRSRLQTVITGYIRSSSQVHLPWDVNWLFGWLPSCPRIKLHRRSFISWTNWNRLNVMCWSMQCNAWSR